MTEIELNFLQFHFSLFQLKTSQLHLQAGHKTVVLVEISLNMEQQGNRQEILGSFREKF